MLHAKLCCFCSEWPRTLQLFLVHVHSLWAPQLFSDGLDNLSSDLVFILIIKITVTWLAWSDLQPLTLFPQTTKLGDDSRVKARVELGSSTPGRLLRVGGARLADRRKGTPSKENSMSKSKRMRMDKEWPGFLCYDRSVYVKKRLDSRAVF